MERIALIERLASTIVALHRPHPTRVAIDGVDASGKTTLGDELAVAIVSLGRPIIRASVDGFHNPAAVRMRRGPTSPEGYYFDSFDYDTLIESLLQPLGPGGSLAFRRAVFDFRADEPVRAPAEHAQPDAILILDGVFLHRPELREHFDFTIFLRIDFEVALARVEERDLELFGSVEEIRRRYRRRYIPGQQLYITEVQPERRASVVIDNNDPLRPVVVPAGNHVALGDGRELRLLHQ
jgi:uridine kinase